MASAIVYWHAKNQRKLEMAFSSVKRWNESGYGMTASGVSEFISMFGGMSLFGSVNVAACPLLTADNRSV
jgi:hypothetical protein